MVKNNYIQNKGLKTVFIASVLISVISQLNILTDSVIVSHFVSPDAISAIGIASPIMMLLNLVLGVLCSGATILVTKEMGMQHYTNVTRIFTVCLLTAFMVGVTLILCILPCTDTISCLLTDDQRLQPLVIPYLKWSVSGSICLVLMTILATFVRITGRSELVTKATIVELVTNILLELLFVCVMDFGIAGAAIASALSYLASCLFMSSVIFRQKDIIAIERPEKTWFIPWQKKTIQTGMPSAIGTICMSAMFLLLNGLVQKAQGADGMFILNVSIQMIMISSLVLNGAGMAIGSIGGVLLGERDIDGYRRLINGLLKKVIIGISVITVVLMIFPDMLSGIFGATGHLQDVVRQPLRLMSLFLLPLSISMLLANSFLLQGHNVLASIILSLLLVCIIPPAILSTMFFPQYMWHTLPSCLWLMLAIIVCCTFIISRRNRTLHWFTLIPKLPNDPSVSLSVDYNHGALQETLDKIHLFLDVCDLPHDIAYNIDSCIEELTYNLISMTEQTGKTGFFDIRVVDTGEKILVVMKDDGKSYSPILKFNGGSDVSAEDENLALVMLNAMCPDINHKYMNGINCTYLNFPYKS